VAKDRGDPSASSETVLVVNVLDVNDNDPQFPMNVSTVLCPPWQKSFHEVMAFFMKFHEI
jgi:hypothetical protein